MNPSQTLAQENGTSLHNGNAPTDLTHQHEGVARESSDYALSKPINGSTTFLVDFSWKKWKAIITTKNEEKTPLYTVDFKTFKPNLVFQSQPGKTKFATGILHPVSINADCTIHGKEVELTAMKRFKTQYQHLSYAYSDTDEPVPMTWTSNCGLKNWNFICLDAQQNPVAKFAANQFSFTNVGEIEFMGPKANDAAVRDEIVVTSLTLFYCMLLRSSSLLSFFGAIISSPGPAEKKKQ